MFLNTFTKIFLLTKNWLILSFSILGSFFLPLQPLIIVVTTLAILDWVTKIISVWKKQGYDAIKSNKMQDTFIKIIMYGFFLSTLFIVDQLFIKTMCVEIFNAIFEQSTSLMLSKIQLASVGTLMILVREFKSIDENWEDLYGYSFIKILTANFEWFLKWKK